MKIAIVTGASQGLGKEIARLLVERGYSVLTPTRQEMDLESGHSIEHYAWKVKKIDLLVNNAAVMNDNLLQSIQVNALAAHQLSSALMVPLKKSNGRVVNISSREGLMHENNFGRRPYSVSKSALNALTRMLADQMAGISVCACCPGWFRSRLGGDRAPISADEAADTPVWLATEAQDINGKFFINRQPVPW